MSYSIRFKSRAKLEFEQCCAVYGPSFRNDVMYWLKRVAAELEEDPQSPSTIDYMQVLEEGLGEGLNDWKYSWKMWWQQSGTAERMRGVLYVLRKFSPPYKHFMTCTWIEVLGVFAAEVQVYGVVHHSQRELVIVKLDGLPGQI